MIWWCPHRFRAWGRLQLPKRDGFAHQLVSARKCLAHNWRGTMFSTYDDQMSDEAMRQVEWYGDDEPAVDPRE